MKDIRPILLLLVLVLPNVGRSQSFDQLIEKADSFYDLSLFDSSGIYFEKAFLLNSKSTEMSGYYYNAACSFSLAKDLTKSIFYLDKSFSFDKSINETKTTISHLMSDYDLEFLWNTPEFNQVISKYYSKEDAAKLFSEIKFEEISYESLLKMINDKVSRGEKNIIIRNRIIYWKKENDTFIYNEDSDPIPIFDTKWDIIVRFYNCDFQLHLNLIRETEYIGDSRGHKTLQTLYFMHCNFFGKCLINNIDVYAGPEIGHNTFYNSFEVSFNISNPNLSWNSDTYFNIYGNQFKDTRITAFSNFPLTLRMRDNHSSDSSDVHIEANNISDFQFTNNSLPANSVFIVAKAENMSIVKDDFNHLILAGVTINSKFDFLETKIRGKFLLKKTVFSDLAISNVNWEEIKQDKLGLPVGDVWTIINLNSQYNKKAGREMKFITGENETDISQSNNFTELLGVYSMFLKLYKEKNDLESFNSCYIAIKKLQSKRLQYLYHSNKTFESYFRWKLSQLLEFYVRFGTDPARAIVISLYIIFSFGVFFFFFPSDWDVTSKKTLIQNFKDFAQKNEKGYVKPFFILTWGFIVSLINALTLSLNAFITLGFGNIPTHGIARYVCVFEGFLGWFLLSIFTVALINQIL